MDEVYPSDTEWDITATVTLMESTSESEQARTPWLAPLEIKLDFFDEEGRRLPVYYPSRCFNYTVGQLLQQESRRHFVSLLLSDIYMGLPPPPSRRILDDIEEQLLDFFLAPVEEAWTQGKGAGAELRVDVRFSHGGGGFGGVPASSDSIRELEAVRYVEAGGGVIIREEDCMICMEEFEVGMEVRRMPCTHVFHGDCLVRWLESSRLCPLCRHAMPASTDL